MPFDADCDEITIQCVECDVIGAKVLVDQDQHGQPDLPGLEAEAIEAWNTRAIPRATGDDGELVDLFWRIKEKMPVHHEELLDLADRITALRAEVERLRGLVEELADDLVVEVRDRWGHDERLARKLKRDMEVVIRARQALGAKP